MGRNKKIFDDYSKASSIPYIILSNIIVGLIIGLTIEHFFDTNGIAIIVMVLLGIASGYLALYKLLKFDSKEKKDE